MGAKGPGTDPNMQLLFDSVSASISASLPRIIKTPGCAWLTAPRSSVTMSVYNGLLLAARVLISPLRGRQYDAINKEASSRCLIIFV